MKIRFIKNCIDEFWWISIGIGCHRHVISFSLVFYTIFIKWGDKNKKKNYD